LTGVAVGSAVRGAVAVGVGVLVALVRRVVSTGEQALTRAAHARVSVKARPTV